MKRVGIPYLQSYTLAKEELASTFKILQIGNDNGGDMM
jgi:hypothetical protein